MKRESSKVDVIPSSRIWERSYEYENQNPRTSHLLSNQKHTTIKPPQQVISDPPCTLLDRLALEKKKHAAAMFLCSVLGFAMLRGYSV